MGALVVGLMVGVVTSSCSPSADVSPPAHLGIEVLETRVEPPLGGNPVVAVRIRAPRRIGNYGFSWSAAVAAVEPPTSFGPPCRPLDLYGSVDLLSAEAGTVFPAFLGPGPELDAGVVREGWLSARLADGLLNVGLEGCELAFSITAGYLLIDGGDFVPAADPPSVPVVVATVRVRGDGTALTSTPLPIVTPVPTLSPTAIEADALTRSLLPILSDWNAVAEPVAIGLATTSDLGRWAEDTQGDRLELSRIYGRLAAVTERITVPALIDPFSDIAINYATKLDGLEAIAAGAQGGDADRVRVGFAKLEIAVRQAPGIVQQWVATVGPYVPGDQSARMQAILDAAAGQ